MPIVFAAEEKIVVAHRGASGYLPEHSLEAKVLAHAMGADYIEQDVVMTRDDALVVLHDLTLDRVTNVAEVFAGRARPDGRFYVIDFTLEELRQLRVTEGRVEREGGSEVIFPARFPPGQSRFSIHTLAEEIELIQGLNATTGREAGIYVEVKSPWFHHQHGKDASRAILEVLRDYGYESRQDKVYLQSFDFNEIRRLRKNLLPQMHMDIALVQLIARTEWQETREYRDGQWVNYDYTWMHQPEAMAEISHYAQGVGPSLDMIVETRSTADEIIFTSLVTNAHAAGLEVHPYTFRRDPGSVPDYAGSFERLLEIFLLEADVDGLFTDFPDLAVAFLNSYDD